MSNPTLITDPNGETAQVVELSPDKAKVHVRLEDGRTFWVDRGAIRQEGGTLRFDTPFGQGTAPASAHEPDLIVPVFEERAHVERQVVETGKVQISKRVVEHQEFVVEPILREDVVIKRVPMNQEVTGPLSVRYEGDVMIVPLVEEVVVTQKKLMLREEVRISRKRETVPSKQPVTLRKEEVVVDRDDHPKQP